ncbi:hypothetical protein [Microbacterium sp. zg.Y1084]|uniref:hypothetical protein n=1 Tax=Microbacterium sp. zg.Y1084 TaxID=2969667 RepID=UPI00214B2A16|nr:hypothetical protein [Microbacterium sp. zg.Y1084]MCR2813031.1 hypothetical protein [Microbacterium sp. zg.Y1084]
MNFEPRSMIKDKHAFGRSQMSLDPAEGVDEEDHRYRSAILQHRIATTARDLIQVRYGSIERFAEAHHHIPGMSLDRIRRMLRGETTITFADFALFAVELPFVAKTASRVIETWPSPERRQ